MSVSIGIYEDIFRKKYDKVAIDYYSEDQERLSPFRQQLVKGKLLTKVLAVRYFEA